MAILKRVCNDEYSFISWLILLHHASPSRIFFNKNNLINLVSIKLNLGKQACIQGVFLTTPISHDKTKWDISIIFTIYAAKLIQSKYHLQPYIEAYSPMWLLHHPLTSHYRDIGLGAESSLVLGSTKKVRLLTKLSSAIAKNSVIERFHFIMQLWILLQKLCHHFWCEYLMTVLKPHPMIHMQPHPHFSLLY